MEPPDGLPRSDLVQIANARDRIDAVVTPWRRGATVPDLIHRNAGLAVAGNRRQDCHPAVVRRHQTKQAGGEELMSVAEQAFLLTGELFVLSFVGIWAFWLADKLRRNFTGKP
jgi:hypothetical protein